MHRARKYGLAEPPQDVDDHDQNLQALQPKFINNQENPDDQHQELGAGLGANQEDQEQHEDPIPNAERDIFYTVWVSKKRRTRKTKRRSFEGFYLPFVLNNNTRITGPFEDERCEEEASSSEKKDPTWAPSSDEEMIILNGNSAEQNEIEDGSEQGEEEGNHEDELEDEDDQEDEGNSSDEHGSDSSWSPSDQSDDNDDY